jgi:hypothetical protein
VAYARAAEVLGGVGEQRQVTRPLDCVSERALMLGTGAGPAPRFDAATIGYESAEEVNVFVVHNLDLIGAHDAYPAAAAHPAPGPLLITSRGAWPLGAGSFGTTHWSRGIVNGCGLGDQFGCFVLVGRLSLSHIAPLFEGNVLGSNVPTNRHGIAVFG